MAALALAASPPAFAQDGATQATPTPAPATPPLPPCATPEHRAFDFWVGEWDVTPANSPTPTATNSITRVHGGCVIKEDYKTQNGYSGSSINFYDAQRKKWHQTWMGMDGGALFIEGGPDVAGRMVLSNVNTPYYQGGQPIQRVTWTPNGDGSVRQHWQSSTDGGETWSTVFDGRYVRRGEGEAAAAGE